MADLIVWYAIPIFFITNSVIALVMAVFITRAVYRHYKAKNVQYTNHRELEYIENNELLPVFGPDDFGGIR